MLSLRTFRFDSGGAYPGEFTPTHQMIEALSKSKRKRNSVHPEVTIRETPEYYKIELSAPGLKRENLLVNINEAGDLCIFGYHIEKEEIISNYSYKESESFHSFSKKIPLPVSVDPSFTSAQCQSGVLSILFTKSEKPVKKMPSTIVVY